VRVEIAGRAHRGKFTPKLGISPERINVKKKRALAEYFFEKIAIGAMGDRTEDEKQGKKKEKDYHRGSRGHRINGE
jgi:hypothetical protein